MGLTQAITLLAVLAAVVIALPQHQYFGQVHSAQQQPGNLYVVPDSHHNPGFRQLVPVVPVGPVAVALHPSRPVMMLPGEQGVIEGSLKPVYVIPDPSDARKPDFSAFLNKLTGTTTTPSTVTSTVYDSTSTVYDSTSTVYDSTTTVYDSTTTVTVTDTVGG